MQGYQINTFCRYIEITFSVSFIILEGHTCTWYTPHPHNLHEGGIATMLPHYSKWRQCVEDQIAAQTHLPIALEYRLGLPVGRFTILITLWSMHLNKCRFSHKFIMTPVIWGRSKVSSRLLICYTIHSTTQRGWKGKNLERS